jgi:hypothetical protein
LCAAAATDLKRSHLFANPMQELILKGGLKYKINKIKTSSQAPKSSLFNDTTFSPPQA